MKKSKLNQVLEDLKVNLKHLTILLKVTASSIAVIWLLSGIYVVQSDEEAVVRRFGRIARESIPPGMHYHLPLPIESVDKPKVRTIRRVMIGYKTDRTDNETKLDTVIIQRLTGDINIINLTILLQYSIKNASDYLFQTEKPEDLVSNAAQAAITEILGRMTVDEALTVGKLKIQALIHELTQKSLDNYRTGIQILAADLQELNPPQKVIQAFRDVIDAQANKKKFINDAQASRSVVISQARGEMVKLLKEAEAYKEEKINRSSGEANRFLAILKEYQKAPEVTKDRMYLETMDTIGPRMNKFIISSQLNKSLTKIYGATK
jgi:membrane protease subunit HflK